MLFLGFISLKGVSCFNEGWGGGVFQDVGAPLPWPPTMGNPVLMLQKILQKVYSEKPCKTWNICVQFFFWFSFIGKNVSKYEKYCSCSRKLKVKETFEKVSHVFGCEVAWAFHSSEVEEMITTKNIIVGIGVNISFVYDPFPFWNFVSAHSKVVKHLEP